jgi:protein phosphatase
LSSNRRAWDNPGYQTFYEALTSATEAMKAEKSSGMLRGIETSGDLCEIFDSHNLVIIGDLHGDYSTLDQIFREVDTDSYFDDPLNKMIFLGDYVDRGINSIGILNSVCQLKLAHPYSIVLMRGNHEAPAEFPFGGHDFPNQLVSQFGESAGATLYQKSLAFFRELVLTTIVTDALLIVHGGLPTDGESPRDHRKMLSLAQKQQLKNRVFEEILWNDPRDLGPNSSWEDSWRGLGRHFGEVVTVNWLAATGTRCVIRAHEPCKGFRIDHAGKVMTIFSSRAPYPSFQAAYLSLKSSDLQNLRDARNLVRFVKYL